MNRREFLGTTSAIVAATVVGGPVVQAAEPAKKHRNVWFLTQIGERWSKDAIGINITIDTEAEARQIARDIVVAEYGRDGKEWLDPSKTRCEPFEVFVKRTGYKFPFVFQVTPQGWTMRRADEMVRT